MKHKKLIIITISAIATIGIAIALLSLITKKPLISKDIQKKAGFTIFVPTVSPDASWKLDPSNVKYDSEIGVLYTSLLATNNSNKITMTQQVLPDPFSDIPNYASIFYGKLNEYQELSLPIGRVVLTRPTELKGGQSAVSNIRGTLMFLHPDHDLSDDDWKNVFKNLESL